MRSAPKIKYLIGDARKVLKGIPDGSVQCVVTSPPYFGLRNYKIPPSVWGGDPDCDHRWGDKKILKNSPQRDHNGSDAFGDTRGEEPWRKGTELEASQGRFCQKCGGWYGCLGNEPTPKMFEEHIVEVFHEVWRVLRDDGVAWLNLGDSHASGGRGYGGKSIVPPDTGNAGWHSPPPGLKPKDLVGIPWMVAFALRDAGWHLRQHIIEEQIWTCPDCGSEMEITRLNCDRDIIFSKVNPMPESVTSRPTTSHEYIFMLTKSGDPIYWVNAHRQIGSRIKPEPDYLYIDLENNIEYEDPPKDYDPEDKERWNRENRWRGRAYFYDNEAVREPHKSKDQRPRASGKVPDLNRSDRGTGREFFGNPAGRNLRSVWHIPIKGFSEAHFAVFDRRIPNTCIRASTSLRSCSQCGAPWERIVKKTRVIPSEEYEGKWADTEGQSSGRRILQSMKARRSAGEDHDKPFKPPTTIGWMPTCDCPDNTGDGRCVVLDPFAGSGTTLLEAYNNGRDSIGIDLKKKFAKMAVDRLRNEGNYDTELGEFV